MYSADHLETLRQLNNPSINVLLDEIQNLQTQNRQLRHGVLQGTPISWQPMPRERTLAIIHLAYSRDTELQATARSLVHELELLEQENAALAGQPGTYFSLS